MTNQEIMEAYRLAYKKAAAPTIDQMRSAVQQVYGDNNLNSLDDDAYVRRKFSAGMKGSRARDLQAALQTGNSMTATEGATHKPAWDYGVFERPQQVRQPVQQPVQTAYQPTAPRQYNPAQQAMMAQRAQIEAIRQKQQRMSAAYRQQANSQAFWRQPEAAAYANAALNRINANTAALRNTARTQASRYQNNRKATLARRPQAPNVTTL